MVVLLVLGFAPRPAGAVLVVFEGGRHLHVASYAVEDENEAVALDLVGGGRMTIPLDLVERIVDDELESVANVAPQSPAATRAKRSIRSGGSAPRMSSAYDSLILSAAREHRLDPALLAAVIRAESGFSPRAVSRKGARGLMQLMPATARRLGVKRPFDPHENIQGGAAYLSELATRFGDTAVELVLAAYNAGEGAVEEYGGVPPYRETQAYVKRVMTFWGVAAGTAP